MNHLTLQEIIPVLQTAIGPVILISGLGLLLLTMTNRLGRIIDRSRGLLDDYEERTSVSRSKADREIQVLWKRARLIRSAILLASASCLGASFLIIMLFLTSLSGLNAPLLIAGIFILSMTCLIFSLVYFLRDVNLTLAALKIELEGHKKNSD
jgi:hypothetical protein